MVDEATKDDYPKVKTSDLGKFAEVSDSDFPKLPKDTKGYEVIPVARHSKPAEFTIIDPEERRRVMYVGLDKDGSIFANVPSIPSTKEAVSGLIEDYFADMGEESTSVDQEPGMTMIHSSSKAGTIFTLSEKGVVINMKVVWEDSRLRQMPNPLVPLMPLLMEVKGIPGEILQDAFSKIQEVRRTLPGHI